MELIKFITNQNLNSTSIVEQIGDLILTPAHLFCGKKFVYFPTGRQSIEIVQDNILLQKVMHQIGPWSKTAVKIILSPFIVLLPLGLLIKSISLINTNTRNAYRVPIEKLTYQNLSKEIYFDIAKHPLCYFQYEPSNFGPSQYTFTPLNLSECACNNEAFNRLTSPHRMQLEERLVHDLTPLVSKKQPPRILSLGCGQLLSEFRFIGLLLAAGHTEIDLDLIDPVKEDVLKNLVEFYKRLGISVRMNWYNNVSAYKKEHPEANVDALFVMDYDEMVDGDGTAANDFITAREHLTPTAKTYLGFSGACVITKDNQYEFLNTTGQIQAFIHIFDRELPNFNKSTLRVGIPKQAPRSLEFLIAVTEWAKKKKIPNIEITYTEAKGSVAPMAQGEKNKVLANWRKNCISDSLQIKEQEDAPQNNYFDLFGPRCFLKQHETSSKVDLRKIIEPKGVVLTLTQASPPQLNALSHTSEHIYAIK